MNPTTTERIEKYIGYVDRLVNPPKKPPAPEPEIRYGTLGTRIFACTLDMLLSMLLISPFLDLFKGLVFTGHNVDEINRDLGMARTLTELFAVFSSHGIWANILINNAAQIIVVSVITYGFWLWKSATPGKLVMRLRIVDATTLLPPSRQQYALRIFGYFVSAVPLFLGFFAVAWSDKHQGWHDKIAHTVVIQDKWNFSHWRKKEADISSASPSAPVSSSPEPAAAE